MAPVRGPRLLACFLVLAGLAAAVPSAHALPLVDYNITNYPSVNFPARQPYFRTIFAPLNADVVVVQEMRSQAGVDSFRTNVLNVLEPGQWASAPFFDGGDTDNALFYKPAKVQLLGAWPFYPNPANLLRYVVCYRLKPAGYTSGAAEIRVYSQHLKASTGFEAQRLAEATGIRDSMNAMPPGTHGLVLGDFNFYDSNTEPGYWKLQESQANNVGRVLDPLNLSQVQQKWHDNAAFVNVHTQCPCVSCPAGSGFSGGGLDDRFDQLLPTYNWYDGEGIDLVPGSYVVVGQDGLHFNKNIIDAPTIPEGAAYATALYNASDHLPSRIDIQVPAKIGVSNAPLAFGTVITGATPPVQNLLVANPAAAPADTLEYGYAPPAGFTAPAGTLTRLAGASASDALGLDTSSPGSFAGNLLVTSNDLDLPAVAIALSGTVLAHAAASVDSAALATAGAIDFGVQPAGGFTDQPARVHDFGYDALRARLAVTGASITGPDAARFSLAGGFTPALVAGTGATWNVHFDDTDAVAGQSYAATLTFACADEPLPGAAAQPDLTFALSAEVAAGTVAVGGPHLPSVTRLYPPFPNPLRGASTVRFDLARDADVKLEVFDLSGRRVGTLADAAFAAGSYSVRWDGRLPSGRRAGAGLYFVRMSDGPSVLATVRLAIVR